MFVGVRIVISDGYVNSPIYIIDTLDTLYLLH